MKETIKVSSLKSLLISHAGLAGVERRNTKAAFLAAAAPIAGRSEYTSVVRRSVLTVFTSDILCNLSLYQIVIYVFSATRLKGTLDSIHNINGSKEFVQGLP